MIGSGASGTGTELNLLLIGLGRRPPPVPTSLAALNAIPSGLRATVGAQLVKAKNEPSRRDWSQVGELVGSMLAGAAKSFSS